MDKLREFQAKQREKKDQLEKLIKREKFDLEMKHRREKNELELKHSQMRAQLKGQQVREREQRAVETSEKKSLKRKARIENDLYELLHSEEKVEKENNAPKKLKCSVQESTPCDVTNNKDLLGSCSVNLEFDFDSNCSKRELVRHTRHEPNDEINSFQQQLPVQLQQVQQQQQQQYSTNSIDDTLLNQSIDLSLFDTTTENIAKTLLDLNK